MKNIKTIITLLLVAATFSTKAQVKEYKVKAFNKVIISPHIEVILKKGETESVVVNDLFLPIEKLNIEIEGKNTLRVYLDGAKIVAKNEKVKDEKWNNKRAIYKGTKVRVTITYKKLDAFSVRGEEKITFDSPLNQKELTLRVYGESQIYLNEVHLNKLKTTIYGESYIEAKAGTIKEQRFTAYGESVINTETIENLETKVTAYGSSSFKLNVIERLKITAYGEATIAYKGSPNVSKGIMIGATTIVHLN